MPALSDAEWRGVQRALLKVCADARGHGGLRAGAWQRGLARLGRILPGSGRTPRQVAPEVQSLKDFLHERARRSPARDHLASQLQQHGFSPAQIAALELIAG